ncbi:MAG TPA: hypothetical protein VER96_37805 [Polyangiaceae bacterium]|nr:hypothetical protein [Polyangiaceae bacterium]
MVGRLDLRAKWCASILAGLSPLLCAATAAAQENWSIPGFDTVGGGIFVGYAFGAERGLDWGIEGFATHFTHDVGFCSQESRAGLGPLLRLSVLNVSRLAVTGALHGGGEAERSLMALDAELGGTIVYQNGGARGAIHTGLLAESLFWNLYSHQEWLLPSYSLGVGMRVQPTFGDVGFCAEGRPFRGARGRARLAGATAASAFDARSPDAARWTARARDECASVPAFLQLARELAELGAPTELVLRALAAAEEELGHTRAAAELASLFGGARLALNPPTHRFRPALSRKQALLRLARESWCDGYLNEGLAASIARAELSETRTREEADALRLIEREESGHAALALDVLRWSLKQAPDLVQSLRVPRETPVEHAASALLTRDALRALAHAQRRTARAQLAELRG